MCAELLKAQQFVFKMERWQGNYYHHDTSAYSIHPYSGYQQNGQPIPFSRGIERVYGEFGSFLYTKHVSDFFVRIILLF